MITNKQLFTLIKKSTLVSDLYDKDMDKLARSNGGVYQLDQDTQLELTNRAFNTVLGTSNVNVTYDECVAYFDIIQSGI